MTVNNIQQINIDICNKLFNKTLFKQYKHRSYKICLKHPNNNKCYKRKSTMMARM